MLPREVKTGFVLSFSYLWHWQFLEGREEGDKDQPCFVLALVEVDEKGTPIGRVLPITHSPPSDPRFAVEIPPLVKRRLQLDDERSWIMLTESNRFAWPCPELEPVDRLNGYHGPLPPALFDQVKQKFVALARSGAHVSMPWTV